MNTLCRLQMVSFNKNMKYVVLAMKLVSLIRDKPRFKSLCAILLENIARIANAVQVTI